MKKLGIRNYTLISEAVKATGTFDPKENFHFFEESLYIHESDTIYEFLQWVTDGGVETIRGGFKRFKRGFGHGNYEDRFKEFLLSKNVK